MKTKKNGNLGQVVRLAAVALATVGLAACGGGGNNNDDAQSMPKQALAIDVLSALVAPTFTLDGGPFPVSEYNDGNFVLRSTTSANDLVPLGSSHTVNPASVRVVQDSYDVLYQHEAGNGVPQNMDTPVQPTGAINAAGALPIAVISWTVAPSFTHNGGAFPVSEYDDGVFYLRPNAGGEDIFLGNSHTVSPDSVLVMDGDYDVIYALETGGDLVPGNQHAVVSNVSINADDSAFAIDVASVRFQLNATHNGGTFPASQYQHARFFLRSTTTDDRVELGKSYELPLTQMVAEGTYDLVYQHVQGAQLPVNSDAVIAAGVLIGSAGVSSVAVDIESVAITPAFTLDVGDSNGPLAFPASEYSDANFYLRSVNNPDDAMFIGASEVAPIAVRVINSDMAIDSGTGTLGPYAVLYRHESGNGVPQNTNAVVPGQTSLTLNNDANLPVSVTSVNITGSFTLNGNNFPGDADNSVKFLLRDANNISDEFLFGLSDLNNEAVKLIPGTYDVLLDFIEGDDVPQNEKHTVRFNELLDADNTLRVNVSAKGVNPSFSLDAAPFQVSIYQSARFYLLDTSTNKRIFLGNSYGNNSAVTVLNGNYDVVYEHRNGGEVPQNSDSKVRSVVVQ